MLEKKEDENSCRIEKGREHTQKGSAPRQRDMEHVIGAMGQGVLMIFHSSTRSDERARDYVYAQNPSTLTAVWVLHHGGTIKRIV